MQENIRKTIASIINIKEVHLRTGIIYYTGRLLINEQKLDFMFDLTNLELYVFKWQRLSRQDNESIYKYLCSTFHPGLDTTKEYTIYE